MKIVFLCNEYPPGHHGGVGTLTQTLGRALAARGHHVTSLGIYRVPQASRETDCGVQVIRLPHWRVRGLAFLMNTWRLRKELRRVERESGIDLLEGPEMSLACLKRQMACRKIIRMHGGHHFFTVPLGRQPNPWRACLERRSFWQAGAYCAVSRFVAETTRGLLGLGEVPIEILPNPVDTEKFKPLPKVGEEAGLIAFVGTLTEKKGVLELVQAMPRIVEKVLGARLWLVGRDSNHPSTGKSYAEFLRQHIPASLESRVEFKGAVPNEVLPQLLARCQVAVFPSHLEAQGLVVIEGMAVGKAVVASQIGPGPEVLEDGVSGLLCDPHDPESIARRVVQLRPIAELRANLGQNARRRTVEAFSVEGLVQRNEAFYERCLGSRTRS